MPRLPRSYFQTSFFHVISQGIEKKFIFDEPDDIKKYIHFMYEILEDYHVKIIAYCIMNNHSHILLEVESISNLSLYMQRLNTKYANYYNTKYNRVGFVFRNRFKSEGIFSEKYLYNCINYIFMNPVKAEMCDGPKDYPYSNYKEYVRENNIVIEKIDDECNFIDIDEDKESKCNEIIENFLNKNNKKINQLPWNLELLKELLVILSKEKISLLMIEKKIGINRKKLKSILYDKI